MYGHSAPEVLTVNTLLIINSSPRSNSVSRRLTRHFAEEWKAKHPDTRVVERDLTANPLPFVTEPWIQASYTPPAQRTPQQQQALALSDALIDELMAAAAGRRSDRRPWDRTARSRAPAAQSGR